MTSNGSIEVLTEGECWARLGNHVVGRLVVVVGRQPDVFPVNYRVDDGEIVVRTTEGTKLAAAIMGERVAFEIDDLDELHRGGWSVVVHGVARESSTLSDVMHDEIVDTEPWAAGTKNRVIRITAEQITGRRIYPTLNLDRKEEHDL
jgi:nitroimidazol reductase NimA-like FMN-containing flavoprotein (pyridoxamine 5'-phosphate oxidase superfamily)